MSNIVARYFSYSPTFEGLFPAPIGMMKYSTALLATLGLGVSLLLINAIIFGLVIWRRPRGGSNHKLTVQQQQPLQVSWQLSIHL